jgi:hypothetical protein
MDKLVIVSIAVLSLVPQLNSQPVNLDTSKAEPIVSGFFVTRENKFPDRSKEAEVARQVDAQREQARLEAIRQAEIQKQAQVQAQAQKPAEVAVSSSGLPPGTEQLKMCESGNNYANKNNPKYRGAYQYDISTWGGFGGFTDPADAPPSVQDAKFLETYNRRGKSPWPSCGRFLP